MEEVDPKWIVSELETAVRAHNDNSSWKLKPVDHSKTFAIPLDEHPGNLREAFPTVQGRYEQDNDCAYVFTDQIEPVVESFENLRNMTQTLIGSGSNPMDKMKPFENYAALFVLIYEHLLRSSKPFTLGERMVSFLSHTSVKFGASGHPIKEYSGRGVMASTDFGEGRYKIATGANEFMTDLLSSCVFSQYLVKRNLVDSYDRALPIPMRLSRFDSETMMHVLHLRDTGKLESFGKSYLEGTLYEHLQNVARWDLSSAEQAVLSLCQKEPCMGRYFIERVF